MRGGVDRRRRPEMGGGLFWVMASGGRHARRTQLLGPGSVLSVKVFFFFFFLEKILKCSDNGVK